MSQSESSTDSTPTVQTAHHGGMFMLQHGGKVLIHQGEVQNPYDSATGSQDDEFEMPDVSGVFMLEEEIKNLLVTIDVSAQALLEARRIVQGLMNLAS